jgi:hypothetical protein
VSWKAQVSFVIDFNVLLIVVFVCFVIAIVLFVTASVLLVTGLKYGRMWRM